MKTRAWSTGVILLGVVVLASTVLGATSTRSFTNDSRGSHPNTVSGDNSQITVDLSALPEGTPIYRAIFVHKRGGHNGAASSANQPLRIEASDDPGNWLPTLAPRHLYIDCTAAAQRGVQGAPKQLVLNMVSFPGFSFSAGVRVDITCDQPVINTIGALTNINAKHTDGDTMVTWTEREQLLPDPNSTVAQYEAAEATFDSPDVIRYRIYRHSQPIDATTIRTAELVDEIPPLSAWNPYYYGLYWRDSDTQIVPRLPVDNEVLAAVDQGIYVRHAEVGASTYHAVSLAVNGEEDLSNWTAGQNCTASAVVEAVGTGMVLLRVKQLDTTFMYESNVDLYYYVRWDCPSHYNVPSHALDYLVGVPSVTVDPRPVDVALHCWGANLNGGFGWWYEADKGALLVSTNMQPYDWWTAYHDNYGTIRPFTDVDGNGGGRVRRYAQYRILSFLNDFVKENYSVDDNRILVTGSSMGGAGCIMWGCRDPNAFAYANGWVGVYIPRETPQFKGSFEGVYGLDAWNCEYEDTGVAAFDYWDSAQFILADPGQEVPYLCFANGKNDSAIGWPQAYTFVNALIQAHQPFKFKWGQSGHGERSVLPAGSDRYIGIVIKKNVTLPAFTNGSLDDNMGNGDPADGDLSGNLNAYTLWETDTPVDQADRWEMTLYLDASAPLDTCTVDITPRRCQVFSLTQGTQVNWTNMNVTTSQQAGSGTAVADQWGLVTLTGMTVSKDRNRIVIIPTGVVTVAFDQAASNGDESVTPANLSVSLSEVSGDTITVDYAVTGGTATGGGVDYTLNPGQLQFDPSQVTKNIPITIVDDGDPESDETVEVTLSNPVNASLGAITVHIYTINDNDGGLPVVTIQATDPNAAEQGQDPGVFTVGRDQTSGNLVVYYSVGGTAGPGDYQETLSGQMTILDGQPSATITITPVDDSEVEGNETVVLTLTADPAYTIGSPGSDTVTITDNDGGGPPEIFYVTRDNGINCSDAYDNQGAVSDVRTAKWGCDESYTMDFDTDAIKSFMGSNPISDYNFTLYIMPSGGWPASPVSVDVQTINTNDDWAEGDDPQRFNPFGWTEGTPAATGEYAQTYWVDVGGTPTLDAGNCIAWTREDGTPESMFKYLPANFTNSIALTGSSADHGSYISVALDENLVNDLLNNAKNRGLRMYRADGADNLQNYTREAAGGQRPYLEVVYTGGVPKPTVTIQATDPSAAEELQDTGTFTVSRDQTSGDLVVHYSVGGTAGAGDYEETLSGQVTILDGQPSATITITPVDDTESEGDETVVLTLTADPTYEIGSPSSDTVTIADNDVLPTVAFDLVSSSGEESITPKTLAVSLSGPSSQTVTVDYAVTGGTATGGGVDYTLAAGTLTFDPNDVSETIDIAVVDDGLVESDETVEVTLSNPSNATLGANTMHTYTINDNDAYPTVAFDLTASSGDESVTPASLTVSLSAAYVETVTVDYAVTGGTATGGGVDYTLAAGTLTFDPNDVAKTIDITIVDDTEDESDETIEVTLSNPSNATLGANTVHTYTILDNDGVSPPGQATNPSPADGATKVSRSVILSWTAGSGADSHDVYFGTNPNPGPSEFQGNQTDTTFVPGYLGKNTWYYWRIDEVNAGGTTTGVVWSFRTGR
ncbi:MAG TPA: Calx-beta domain-containing protein [Phycisphaerae bacterium]|nr:Calx-beta domain-containing protein [Phycisphaerae bacterium]